MGCCTKTRCVMQWSLFSQTSKTCLTPCLRQRSPRSLACVTCAIGRGSFNQLARRQVMDSTKGSIGFREVCLLRNERLTTTCSNSCRLLFFFWFLFPMHAALF